MSDETPPSDHADFIVAREMAHLARVNRLALAALNKAEESADAALAKVDELQATIAHLEQQNMFLLARKGLLQEKVEDLTAKLHRARKRPRK